MLFRIYNPEYRARNEQTAHVAKRNIYVRMVVLVVGFVSLQVVCKLLEIVCPILCADTGISIQRRREYFSLLVQKKSNKRKRHFFPRRSFGRKSRAKMAQASPFFNAPLFLRWEKE